MSTAQKLAFAISTLLFAVLPCKAQKDNDVFIPIAKYIQLGDADKLSVWFADNLEISIFSKTNDCSRNQARQILKSFFEMYSPRKFDITHTAGGNGMKYAIGLLNAGGQRFDVSIFVSLKDGNAKIQHLKIDRRD